MTSVTARCLHEQSLLLDKTRKRLGRPRRTRIISGTAEQSDHSLRVKFTNFLSPDTLQLRTCKLPGFHPTLGDSNLLRCPIGNERELVVHGLSSVRFSVINYRVVQNSVTHSSMAIVTA